MIVLSLGTSPPGSHLLLWSFHLLAFVHAISALVLFVPTQIHFVQLHKASPQMLPHFCKKQPCGPFPVGSSLLASLKNILWLSLYSLASCDQLLHLQEYFTLRKAEEDVGHLLQITHRGVVAVDSFVISLRILITAPLRAPTRGGDGRGPCDCLVGGSFLIQREDQPVF